MGPSINYETSYKSILLILNGNENPESEHIDTAIYNLQDAPSYHIFMHFQENFIWRWGQPEAKFGSMLGVFIGNS